MLVLSRKLQQQIRIGEEITVTVLRIKGNTVRVGVQAPRDVRVIRGELPKQSPTESPTLDACDNVEISLAIVEPLADGEPADEAAATDVQPSAAVRPAHLPLRRIGHRYGNGPLRQVIASCHTLAK